MPNEQLATERPDPIVEYYKQFVDREALRTNLKLTPEERLLKLEEKAQQLEEARLISTKPRSTSSTQGQQWETISDVSPNRTTNPITELYKRDVDRTLLRENLKLTPEQRLQKLDSMGEFVEALRAAARKSRGRQ